MENLILFDKCDGQFDPDFLNANDWESVKRIISEAFDSYVNQVKR
jgi:hypothetical protein